MLKTFLENINQHHLLRFADELSIDEQEVLAQQLREIDFSYLDHLNKADKVDMRAIEPINVMRVEEIKQQKNSFEKIGLESLAKGEVGLVLVAGGMGTRLGIDGPKGVYNIGKTRDVFIFQCLFENALEVVKKCGKMMPFFIMTSEKNNQETIEFLEAKNYFGYDKNMVKFFIQEMAPCVGMDGKILLEEKGRVATSPNGHGGWFKSLVKNPDTAKALEESGVQWLNVFAVDNVLQKIADPIFVGAVVSGGYDVGAKVVKKADPFEKVGVVCKKNGRPSVVEYVDLTDEIAFSTDENGVKLYDHGVIFNYLFNLDMLYKTKDIPLPIHVVNKKVEHIDEEGNKIRPEKPNALKFEMMCADMVELGKNCLSFEVVREKEFAPIKNKRGVDSVESAQQLLEQNGYIL
ncbi:MAG: UTP--glucose-1-phosphate uridylyltransferase [Clostridia bacterium]|nr:UTP--glucose-1-phosphate uridylyltransferase [Clostridia bacterium]